MKSSLEALRQRYDTDAALALDPIAIPLRFAEALDREVVAFLAAHLAYGKVAPMLRAIEKVLKPLGQPRWCFVSGVRGWSGVGQIILMFTAGTAAFQFSWLVILPCAALYLASLFYFGARFERRFSHR